ncbi:MAG: Fe-S-containing hydro-lyase [Endomicrobium sp.]|jgi:fumarate hydratase subunit beta|nr:Fe-S-containing hydro-lyase [Endomicrobium sp.]MDR2644703.1 Fe-S-containing hydro-lyase [Endomicrobium sp.]
MKINLQDLILNIKDIKVGQKILFSGNIYTARDAAHKRIVDILNKGEELPIDLKNSVIYYCGPTPTKPGEVVGSCGPTTSSRMDIYTPRILKEGVKVLIGKGARSESVVKSLKENNAVYLVATGGVGALISKRVKKSELLVFEDLGPEAIYRFEVEDMPLIVAIDSFGNNIFNKIVL